MNGSSRQKINEETQALNDTLEEADLIDISRTFHPETLYFLKCTRNILRIDHILGHKSSLGKFKKIEVVPSSFSDYKAVRLDINYRGESVRKKNKNMEIKQYVSK